MDSFAELSAFFQRKRENIRRRVVQAFREFLRGDPDALDEAVQNVTTLAWMACVRLHGAGRWERPLFKSCLVYAIRQHRAGRTITSARRPRPAWTVEDIALKELLDPHQDPVPQVVQTRLDWGAYLETLSPRWRGYVADLLDGLDNAECADRWRVTCSRVSQIRRQVVDGYTAFLNNSK